MSGLLERMIQRTRTSVDTVEPLVRSVYAPFASRERPVSDWSIGEAAAYPALPDPAGQRPRRTLPDSGEPAPLDERSRTPDSGAAGQSSPATGIGDALPHTRSLAGAADASLGPVPSEVMADIPSRTSDLSLATWQPADIQVSPGKRADVYREPPHLEAAQRVTIEPRAHTATPVSRPPAFGPPSQAMRSTRMPGDDTPARRPTAEEHAAPVDHLPEVRISIGHIEVRAAQVADRPRSAAFRPRVSLDDYLRRHEGSDR